METTLTFDWLTKYKSGADSPRAVLIIEKVK